MIIKIKLKYFFLSTNSNKSDKREKCNKKHIDLESDMSTITNHTLIQVENINDTSSEICEI